jgi:hypothetical protein
MLLLGTRKSFHVLLFCFQSSSQQIVANVIIPAFLDFYQMFVMMSRMRSLSKLAMLKLLFPFVSVYRSDIFATVFLLTKKNNTEHVWCLLSSATSSSVLP